MLSTADASTTYATKTALTQTEDRITSEVSKTYQSKSGMSSYATKSYVDQQDSSIKSTVSSVQKTADSALTKATTVEQTADGLEVKIDSAVTTANTAKSTADSAQSTANTAKSTADSAKSTATTANSNASTAKTNAQNALNRATYQYGTCSTAAGTAAKAVSLSGFSLFTGATVQVKFTNANSVANPTLNVNSTGAKTIRAYNANLSASSAYNWVAGAVVTFVYDGTYWNIADAASLSKANSAATAASNAQSTANTANSTANAAKTAAANAAKTATNYLGFSSGGLVVGTNSGGTGQSGLQGNVRTYSGGMEVRNGTTVLARYGASKVELGINSNSSVIDFCAGSGEIKYVNQTIKGATQKAFTIDSDSPVYIDGTPKAYINGYTQPQGIMQSTHNGNTWTSYLVGNGANIQFGAVNVSSGSGSQISVAAATVTMPIASTYYSVAATLRSKSAIGTYDGNWELTVVVRHISSTQFEVRLMRGDYAFLTAGSTWTVDVVVFGFTSNDY